MKDYAVQTACYRTLHIVFQLQCTCACGVIDQALWPGQVPRLEYTEALRGYNNYGVRLVDGSLSGGCLAQQQLEAEPAYLDEPWPHDMYHEVQEEDRLRSLPPNKMYYTNIENDIDVGSGISLYANCT